MKGSTRIVPASVGIIVALIVLVSLLMMTGAPASSTISEYTLVASPVNTAPVLDGNGGDAAWSGATAVDVPVSGGWYGTGLMNLKAVYGNGQIYFKAVYADSSRDSRRAPWVKQADGSWVQVPAKSTAWHAYDGTAYGWSNKDPNAAYEDKFALMWNISAAGFNEGAGCSVSCHFQTGLNGEGNFGRHVTANGSEKIDFWHMKSVRMGPVYSETDDGAGGVYQSGQIHDQNLDNCIGTNNPFGLTEDGLTHTVTWADGRTSDVVVKASCNTDWGRHSDPKTGGYNNNASTVIDGKTMPAFSSATQPANGSGAHPYHIMESGKVAFSSAINAQYQTGDEIAGIRIAPMGGDGADISSASHYDAVNHTWTVEFTRPLNTGTTNDVQFTNLNAEYFFGAAIFDNAQVEHSTSGGVNKMVFAACDAPSLSLSKGGVYWASYPDYVAGRLSVDYSIANGGAGMAAGTQIVGAINTNGVTVASSMPAGLGNIASGGSAGTTVKYNVPSGVGSFMSTIHATAGDACGNSYSYPAV